ncbi:hypothetical protein C8F04DRAFT_1399891 [Mycena alexandri]|uniref:RNI-like protein n=1 Tax=Mycena alexandri TaxID=1745969 RepID=A0AAD6WZJ8_9AGAR|nr:hypothetical protein C8F04DRAFT_1399891 [Mycena alexandri]
MSTILVHTGTALDDYPTNTGYALVSPVQAILVPSPSSSSYDSDLGIGHFPISQPEANIRSSPVRGLARLRSYDRIFLPSWLSDITITGQDIPLRHLYLNANGVGEKAAVAIAGYLTHPACKLESLYLASNPVGDAGVLPIAEALKSNKTLLRLSMASTGLTSKGIVALSNALASHRRIMSLDLAAAQTTRVHGQRYNHLADSAIPAITALMHNPSMRHLDLGRTSLSAGGLEDVKAAVGNSNLCEFHGFRKPEIGEAMSCPLATRRALEANVKQFYPDEKGYDAFSNGLNARFLYSPEDVRLIDSVYRTRDQRGDKEIQRVCDEGDPVWKLVDADV